ncbi:MAG: TrmH family RNA methyltransferase [Cryobacterium sp.]|nr:TrmH family RNA methyltransferase [Oligoflexia bacterium]
MKYKRKNIARAFEIETIWSKRAPLGPYPVILVLDGLKAAFNVGKIVRTANALGLREVFLVGMQPWDPVLARGALKATRTRAFLTLHEALCALREDGYTAYALHPRGEISLGDIAYPEKTAFIVGHEELGLSLPLEEQPDVKAVRIPQFGIVESLNVSVAASIAAFDYLRERKLLGTADPLIPLPSSPATADPAIRSSVLNPP